MKNAHLLHGIVDETGYLAENEVYVVTRDADGVRQVLQGDTMVRRKAPPSRYLQLSNCWRWRLESRRV